MKWLIVEDALRDQWGHWVEYLRTFQRGLKSCGDELTILCDRGADADLVAEFDAKPVLPHSIWHRMSDGAGALRRYARVPGHGCATFFALRRVLRRRSVKGEGSRVESNDRRSEGRGQRTEVRGQRTEGGEQETVTHEGVPDVIFVPTVLVHHLLGWWILLKTGSVPKSSRVLLFFPNAPVRLADNGRAQMAPDATGKLFHWGIRQLAGEVANGKVILGAETHAMQRALTQATGVEFTYLPHPVSSEPKRGVTSDEWRVASGVPRHRISEIRYQRSAEAELKQGVAGEDAERQRGAGSVQQRPEDRDRQPELPDASARPIVFGCYGGARWEKGSDILQAAIRRVLEEEPGIPAKFVFQWMEDFDDERGRRVKLDPWLKNHPKVEVIDRYFADGEYAQRLAATDVMVLPYRSSYRLRVSRVVIEAMMYGMPVIATNGTTLAEQAAEHGCVAVCPEGSAEGVAKIIAEVAAGFGGMRKAAAESVAQVQRQFSVACFRQLLEQEIKGKSGS